MHFVTPDLGQALFHGGGVGTGPWSFRRQCPSAEMDMTAEAQRLWGDLGRDPHTRVNTELFHLAFHAGNLFAAETLWERVDLAGAPLLTDDFAPVDTLAFELAQGADAEP